MKRIKFTSVFLVAIILLVNLATLMVYSENGTHVIVNEYMNNMEKMHQLKVAIMLTLKYFLKILPENIWKISMF